MMKLLETDNACSKTSWVTTHTLRQQCSSGCSVAPLVVLNTAKLWTCDAMTFNPGMGMYFGRSSSRDVKVGRPVPFTADGSQSFVIWVRLSGFQLTLHTVWRLVLKILPTHLSTSAFLLWDTLSGSVKKGNHRPISIYHCGHCHKQNQQTSSWTT